MTSSHQKLNQDKFTWEVYISKLLSATSDGTSVKTGKYNGLLVRLKDDGRPWLVNIHCASHRLDVKDFMVTVTICARSLESLRGT